MKYLLDTHAVIWYLEDSPKLPLETKEIIDSHENSIYICAVSLWEITIKIALNKLKINLTLETLLNDIGKCDFDVLQVKDEYLKKLLELPFSHKDPFDRLLISTALVENLTIITADENIQKYKISWLW